MTHVIKDTAQFNKQMFNSQRTIFYVKNNNNAGSIYKIEYQTKMYVYNFF